MLGVVSEGTVPWVSSHTDVIVNSPSDPGSMFIHRATYPSVELSPIENDTDPSGFSTTPADESAVAASAPSIDTCAYRLPAYAGLSRFAVNVTAYLFDGSSPVNVKMLDSPDSNWSDPVRSTIPSKAANASDNTFATGPPSSY